MLSCNEVDRSSKFALLRKQADFYLVLYRKKTMVRSIIQGCKCIPTDVLLMPSYVLMMGGSSLQSTAKVTNLRHWVTFTEAFRVLEPYAVKVARTVLRRERRGNPPDLSDRHFG
jgi:hypothetical protein